jgi:hypothetical protein
MFVCKEPKMLLLQKLYNEEKSCSTMMKTKNQKCIEHEGRLYYPKITKVPQGGSYLTILESFENSDLRKLEILYARGVQITHMKGIKLCKRRRKRVVFHKTLPSSSNWIVNFQFFLQTKWSAKLRRPYQHILGVWSICQSYPFLISLLLQSVVRLYGYRVVVGHRFVIFFFGVVSCLCVCGSKLSHSSDAKLQLSLLQIFSYVLIVHIHKDEELAFGVISDVQKILQIGTSWGSRAHG